MNYPLFSAFSDPALNADWNLRRKVSLWPLLMFLLLGSFLFARESFAATGVGDGLSGDQHWTREGSPYVIHSNNSVGGAAVGNLTIDPGVVVKFEQNAQLLVGSSLVAHGTANQPIIFTSFYDDSAGGDTDGLGPTTGSVGDWYRISGGDPTIEWDHVEMRYSNLGLDLYFATQPISIRNSLLTNNSYAIRLSHFGSGFTAENNTIRENGRGFYFLNVSDSSNFVKNNNISNNQVYGAQNLTPDAPVDMRNNWWGNASGPKHLAFNPLAQGDEVTDGIIFEPWLQQARITGKIVTELLTSPTTWTKADSPIVILGSSGIGAGGSLTIEPGVVVKFGPGAQFVTGVAPVIAIGTTAEPIIFTALTDDTAGGDTNGDGDATVPEPNYWGRFLLGTNDAIQNAEFRYGSWCINATATPSVSHTLFRDCGIGIYIWPGFGGTIDHNQFRRNTYGINILNDNPGSKITNNLFEDNTYAGLYLASSAFSQISNNEIRNNLNGVVVGVIATSPLRQNNIYGNASFGVLNLAGRELDARENWWGHESGPKEPVLNPEGQGDEISGHILFEPWLGSKAVSEPPARNPVIIIPGIPGTELYNGNDLIWANLGRMFDQTNDLFFTQNLALDNQGDSVNLINLGNVLKKIDLSAFGLSSVTVIDIFKNLLEALGQDGYVENNSLYLFPYDWRLGLDTNIFSLQQRILDIKTQTGASRVDVIAHSMGGLLVKDYINTYGKNDIDKLIFIGTPHLGAPKAAKVILFGDRLDIPWLEEDRIQELAHNSISMHQLLPNQKYFDVFIGYIRKFGFFNQPPPLNYDETKDFLLNEKGLNQNVFVEAEDFFSKNLQDMDLSNLDVYNIAGCKRDTQAGYQFGIGNAYLRRVYYTSGDETVPLPSADYINVPSDHKFYVKKGKHAELPSLEGVRNLILQILNNQPFGLANDVSNSQDFCNFKGKELLWRSPVEVHIYDQTGNHTGPIENNAIEYGIEGVGYDIVGDEKFIFLPTDEGQNYHIIARGQASSTFDLLISDNDSGEINRTQVFNDVRITPQTMVDADISDTSADDSIQIDFLGNGNIQSILASSLLNGEESVDNVSPVTDVNISGAQGLNNWYTSTSTIELTGTDDNSGILETRYSLDGGVSFTQYTSPFHISTEGTTTVYFYSVDRAGNNESIKNLSVKIDKISPEIIVFFDPVSSLFVFKAIDNLTQSIETLCSANSCEARDDAGNGTKLNFQQSKVLPYWFLRLNSIQYAGKATSVLSSNQLAVKLVKKQGVISDFSQAFFLKNQQIFAIIYDKYKQQSIIYSLSANNKTEKQVLSGIQILQLRTEEGNIKGEVK